jgi:hypothetical protein
MNIELEVSKKGVKCLWENGGGRTNSGKCQIIAGPEGQKKKALFVRRKGELSNSLHALVPISVNDVVVECYHKRGNFDIRVYRIWTINENENVAELFEIARFVENEWIGDPKGLEEAIEVAKKKSMVYHCREAMFIE